MLQITIPERDYFDDSRQEFLYFPETKLTLEHSLISLSKWESKWKKPFLSKEPKTLEESVDYIRCMTLDKNVKDNAYMAIDPNTFEKISAYINDSMTATWFNESKMGRGGGRGQTVTSELIYYWMIAFNVPFECQKWHLNRLLTLIKICEIKNQPSKKMKQKDVYAQNRALNAARKKNLNTNG